MTDTLTLTESPTSYAAQAVMQVTLPAPFSGAGATLPPEEARTALPGPTPRLYLTSDLRAATGLSRTHMDFYLREGIVVPTTRTESGFLLFDERELHALRTVLAWRRDGVGIKEIRQRLGRVESRES
jgi:hypothetical protein